MRRGSNPAIIRDACGYLVGVSFGSDFCSEHECGIKSIQRSFGIKTDDISIYGLGRHRNTLVPGDLRWIDKFKTKVETRHNRDLSETRTFESQGFYFRHNIGYELQDTYESRELQGSGLRAAWDEKSFAVVSNKESEISALHTIFDAIKGFDAIIMLGAPVIIFDNPGLTIGIYSRIPNEIKDQTIAADHEYHKIQMEFKATGIEDLLDKAGKRYFSLQPKRKDGSLVYRLNPMDQQKDNFGCFTLADLQQWAVNAGRIPKTVVRK